MYNDLFEKTFNKHKDLVLESVSDDNWDQSVDWSVIGKHIQTSGAKSLEDFLGINEADKRLAGNKYINHITPQYQSLYDTLPEKIKIESKELYKKFLLNPNEGRVRFHSLRPALDGYVAVEAGKFEGKTYRRVGKVVKDPKTQKEHIFWFFIGGHAQYENLIGRMSKR